MVLTTEEGNKVINGEKYNTFFELWEELCLRCFHPTENMALEYDENVNIYIWKSGGKAMILTPYLYLENYATEKTYIYTST